VLSAALVNGIASHVLDFDDTHHPTLIHPSGPVMSAALALCEREPATGTAFLHAVILGIEAECRIGRAVFPAHYDAGWHITGTAGVFGAAVASGCLLKLDARQMAWALGIAATQASGLREMFGTMCKSFHVGRSAQNGLTAALLARSGFTSSERALEAPCGFSHVLSPERDLSVILDSFGQRFEILSNTYKPFACGLVLHPVIDGCISLRDQHSLTAGDIAAVRTRVNPRVLELTGKRAPRTGLEGKFSVYHSAAVAIIHGAAGEAQYADACVRDPAVISLREKVHTEPEQTIGEAFALVEIRTVDGRTLTCEVANATGSLKRPMSDAQIEAKARELGTGVLAAEAVEEIVALCWSAETLVDAGALGRATHAQGCGQAGRMPGAGAER
jgi:2-methylcitrate dehydratase PrpD